MMIRSRVQIRAFHPHMKGIKRALGDLEAEVMDCLWEAPESSVKEIWERLSQQRPLAYTTIMTTMDRLYQKGLLQRVKSGKAFLYKPRFSRQEFEEILTEEVLQGLVGATSEPLMSAFLDLLSEKDPGSLDRLELMIRRRRTGLE
jgi:predicted transcriptional regulator